MFMPATVHPAHHTALLAAGAPPDLALSLGLRQRKRRLLAAAAQAGW